MGMQLVTNHRERRPRKNCRKCGESKDLADAFPVHRNSPDGRAHVCFACRRAPCGPTPVVDGSRSVAGVGDLDVAVDTLVIIASGREDRVDCGLVSIGTDRMRELARRTLELLGRA